MLPQSGFLSETLVLLEVFFKLGQISYLSTDSHERSVVLFRGPYRTVESRFVDRNVGCLPPRDQKHPLNGTFGPTFCFLAFFVFLGDRADRWIVKGFKAALSKDSGWLPTPAGVFEF